MSKVSYNAGTAINYIENKFVNSFGSVAKCGAQNCNRSTAKIKKVQNPDKFKDFFYRCEICSAFYERNVDGTSQKFESKLTTSIDTDTNPGYDGWRTVKINCYSAMYHVAQQKSLEELRIMDYKSDRKEKKTFVSSWIENDSTFKCPALECTAVNQNFQAFVESLCCKENKRQKEDEEIINMMTNIAAEYGRLCEAKRDAAKKIADKKQVIKRAKEIIEEQQQKLKDAEREVKTLEDDFVNFHGKIDATKQKLEEEMAVIATITSKQLALEANPEELFSSAQEKLAKIYNSEAVQRKQLGIKENQAKPLQDNNDAKVTGDSALSAIKVE